MTDFLRNHFRYSTLNSWNKSTSYANNIKLHSVEKPDDIDSDIFWQMLEITQWQETLHDLLTDFGRIHQWQWQAGINGRNCGYVVLYKGGIKPSGYQSYCAECGQKNYQAVTEDEIGICGRCQAKARVNLPQTDSQIFTYPGKDVDMQEDFEDWTISQLQERVELVQDFDKLADSIVKSYIDMCTNYNIIEEEIMVPRTIKVLEPIR